jgi:nucleoside-diphosphate-sugar epimerase
METEKSKILIFGGTGYIGKYMVKASIFLGHPTYVYARPITPQTTPSKIDIHKELKSMGVIIVQVIYLSHTQRLVHKTLCSNNFLKLTMFN